MIRMIPRYKLNVWAETETSASGKSAGQWAFDLQPVDRRAEGLEAEGIEPNICDERLELLAVVRGLEALDDPSWVYLATDSRYVRHGLKYGLHHWKTNGWRWENYGVWEPVKNADLWQRVDRAMDIHMLAWQRGGAIGAGPHDCVDRAHATEKSHTSRWRRSIRSWLLSRSESPQQSAAMVA